MSFLANSISLTLDAARNYVMGNAQQMQTQPSSTTNASVPGPTMKTVMPPPSQPPQPSSMPKSLLDIAGMAALSQPKMGGQFQSRYMGMLGNDENQSNRDFVVPRKREDASGETSDYFFDALVYAKTSAEAVYPTRNGMQQQHVDTSSPSLDEMATTTKPFVDMQQPSTHESHQEGDACGPSCEMYRRWECMGVIQPESLRPYRFMGGSQELIELDRRTSVVPEIHMGTNGIARAQSLQEFVNQNQAGDWGYAIGVPFGGFLDPHTATIHPAFSSVASMNQAPDAYPSQSVMQEYSFLKNASMDE